MKLLNEIISFSDPLEIIGPVDDPVNSICSDSRKVKEGSLFIAVRGITSDGHLFISQAITLGARFILCEETPSEIAENITYIKVANSAVALGNIAAAYYDHPSSKMNLVGVTGTNGKTTIVTLLYQLFQSLGYKTGLLSTIHNRINETIIPSTHTTPDPIQINELLADMIANGCTHCFMEVSSHAADQRRIAGLTFRGGIFTNITHDHLDYHKTFDAYLKAKKSFFDGLPEDAFSLVNKDDRNGMVMVQNTKSRIFSYSLKSTADFKCRIIENQFQGLQLNIDSFNCWFKLIGSFNAYNLLAVYAVAVLLHQDKSEILIRLSNIEPVKGRFNPVISENNITAIVDYAHTPDALLNVLSTIQSIRMHHEKVITLIGAGGNRDAAKRPLMAKIACSMSDRVILTSDNPRFEEPEAIIEEMKKGVDPEEEIKVLVIVNRKEAIKTACALAQPGDIILVAGKGHENYQEIKGVKYPFDDMEILNETLVIINPHQ